MTLTVDAEEVTFPTFTPFTLKDVPADPAARDDMQGRATLYRPREADPANAPKRPAVIVSQGLGGLKTAREHAYGERLASHGYVGLVIDSFAVRNLDYDSHSKRALAVTESTMLADTFACLRLLAHHPAVDPACIGIVGFSYGGMISVLCAYEQINRTFLDGTPDEDLRFAAHVSFYGSSVPRLEDTTATGAPVLVLLGEKDRNVSIPRTREIIADLKRGGAPVEEVMLRNTYHQWDSDDATPRFVRWAIDGVRMRVERDNTIRDEITRLPVTGPKSRSVAIAAGTSPRGYTIKMDAAATQKALDAMFSHFDRAFGWTAEDGSRTSVPAAGRGGEARIVPAGE